MPDEVYRVVVEVVEAMREGKIITLVPRTQRLTTQGAADFLGISRPTLVKLLKTPRSPTTSQDGIAGSASPTCSPSPNAGTRAAAPPWTR